MGVSIEGEMPTAVQIHFYALNEIAAGEDTNHGRPSPVNNQYIARYWQTK
jgi:hypothetical protein